MKEKFDLDTFGKQMPYKVPKGSFSAIEDNVIAQLQSETGHRKFRLRLAISTFAAAAMIAALLWIPSMIDSAQTADFDDVEQAFSELNTGDQDYLIATYQDDIFINNLIQQNQ